jgi:hypothetical protein
MKRTFQLAALAACAVVFLCASLADVQAGDLPDQLTKLLPDNAEVVLLVPSLNEAQRLWDEVRVLVTEIDPEEGEDMPPFAELLGSIPEPYGEALDWTRPLALGINVPNMMAGQQANYSIALPVLKSDADWQGLSQMVQMPTVMEQDGYLLISSLPEYTPGQGPTDLLSNLAAGTVQAAVDMEKLWAVFGPMVDFGLAMAAQPKAGPDGQPAEPAMSQEETQAMAQMVRDFFSSADILSLGLDMRQGHALLSESLLVLAGSPLVPGPQPDFNEALELSRLLPREADWTMVSAVDLPGLIEIYKDFYAVSLTESMSKLGGEQAFPMETFLESYFQLIEMTMAPTALTVDMDHDRMASRMVIKTDRAAEYMALQEQIMEQVSTGFQFMVPQRVDGLKVDGQKVIAWDFTWDSDALLKMAGADMAADEETTAALTTMTELYQKLLPGTRTVVKDDLILMTMDQDLDALADMIKKSKQRRGAPNPELVRLAKQGGSDCQAVFTGDLAPLLDMVFEIMEEFSDEEMPALNMEPIPASFVVGVGELKYSARYEVGLEGLGKFIQAMDELEEPAQADQGQ